MALEKRLVGLNETLRTVHTDYIDKSAELEFLRSKSEDQVKKLRVSFWNHACYRTLTSKL